VYCTLRDVTTFGKEIVLQRAEFNSGGRAKTYGDFARPTFFSATIFFWFQILSSLAQWIYLV